VSVVLALLAAVAYGVSDFVGGLASRRVKAVTVLLCSYPVGALLMLALLPLFPGPVSGATLAWGLAGGVAGFVGVLLMYTALAMAPMNVISPVTALTSASVPVAAGVLYGERPGALAWLGIALGLAAVVMVSRSPDPAPGESPQDLALLHGRASPRAIALALVAGVGFALYFICLARADADSGLWPVVLARLSASALTIPVALRMRAVHRLGGTVLALASAGGALDAMANLFFLLATREGYLSLASVITSLYPAGTVLLAALLLHERTTAAQRAGFAVAAVAVVLVAR
jgi:drug/metabolite transporter (DMT)-like permease